MERRRHVDQGHAGAAGGQLPSLQPARGQLQRPPCEGGSRCGQTRPRLHTLRDRPDLIPYRTSYYDENWGFCLHQKQLEALPEGRYEVCLDSTLAPGALTYGELVLPGSTTRRSSSRLTYATLWSVRRQLEWRGHLSLPGTRADGHDGPTIRAIRTFMHRGPSAPSPGWRRIASAPGSCVTVLRSPASAIPTP